MTIENAIKKAVEGGYPEEKTIVPAHLYGTEPISIHLANEIEERFKNASSILPFLFLPLFGNASGRQWGGKYSIEEE